MSAWEEEKKKKWGGNTIQDPDFLISSHLEMGSAHLKQK